MARSKGSFSSKESKQIASELEILSGQPYKYNFDYLRLTEMLLCHRIAEQVCKYDEDVPLCEKVVTIEIPLIGDLKITPRVFHEEHGITKKPSIHFDFSFSPSSTFKSDIYRAYTDKVSDISVVFSSIYGDKLKELYRRMQEGY